jgi:membrane associated rhomboid family serine protease
VTGGGSGFGGGGFGGRGFGMGRFGGGGFGMNRLGLSLTPWVRRLLLANGVLALLGIVHVIPLGFQVRWLSFVPAEVLLRPWGVVTYMFVHGGIWHVLLNSLVLLFFGPPLEQRFGSGEFLRFYLACGVGGALLGFAFAFSTPVIGASAAVFGLMVAFAWFWPTAPIYVWGIFPVQAKFLVGGLGILTFVSTVADSSSVTAHFAHLGGILAALLLLRFRGAPAFDRPFQPRVKMGWRVDRADRADRADRDARADKTDRGVKTDRTVWTVRTNATRSELEHLDEVDRILDKISASGMQSLTDRERAVLDEVSRRERFH